MKNYLTIEDMANEMQVTTRTIRNYLREGKLKGEKVDDRWRFSNENLYELISLLSIGNQGIDVVEDFFKKTHKAVYESIVIIDIPIPNAEAAIFYRDKILERYNTVYSGVGRKLHYEILSGDKIRVIVSGPIAYVHSFGNFIFEWIQYQSMKK